MLTTISFSATAQQDTFVTTQIDTAVGAPHEITIDEGSPTTTRLPRTVYFLEKSVQAHRGGPDSLQVRKLPDSVVRKFQGSSDFWYVNYPFKKKKDEEKPVETKEHVPLSEQKWFQTVLWLIIIGGFVAFLTVYLYSSNIGLFRKAPTYVGSSDDESFATDNIFEINYQKEIDRAISMGNYRMAIRLLFLRSLKDLSNKKIIHYTQDRTNFDYLSQLHATRYYNDFFRITRDYEYAWYGQFEINPEKFTIIQNDFENFSHQLTNR